MPMLRRRIAWFASFAIAVVLTLWLRGLRLARHAWRGSGHLGRVAVRHLAVLRRLRAETHPSRHAAGRWAR
jgi:hypothetical protein